MKRGGRDVTTLEKRDRMANFKGVKYIEKEGRFEARGRLEKDHPTSGGAGLRSATYIKCYRWKGKNEKTIKTIARSVNAKSEPKGEGLE